MKHSITILSFFSFLLIYSCSNGQSSTQENSEYHSIEDYNPSDELIRFPLENYEIGDDFCYLNKKGDTIIPYGKYSVSYSDTIKTFGIVLAKNSDDLIGINQKDQRLYEIQWYDNGPDYIKEGLFRILRNGKTGYADNSGRIVIEPQFECAYPFLDGKAKVANQCQKLKLNEHTTTESNKWFYIDKKGNKLK